MTEKIGGNMPLNMVHRDQRLVQGKGKALHAAHAGEQRAHQTGAIGHRQGIHILQGHARFPHRLVHHRITGFHMRPAGNFRDHAAV